MSTNTIIFSWFHQDSVKSLLKGYCSSSAVHDIDKSLLFLSLCLNIYINPFLTNVPLLYTPINIIFSSLIQTFLWSLKRGMLIGYGTESHSRFDLSYKLNIWRITNALTEEAWCGNGLRQHCKRNHAFWWTMKNKHDVFWIW